MPTIQFGDQNIECAEGANLRRMLLDAGAKLYNGPTQYLNCHGFGTCGTCAVKVEGNVSEPTGMEKMRLSIPPHSSKGGLRLACQCSVQGDLQVTKLEGWWGQKP